MKIWSPYEIEVILHHRYSPEPFRHHDTSHYANTISRFKAMGIVGNDPLVYPPQLTDLGLALVDMWCSQPIPQAKTCTRYVDPRFPCEDEK